MSIACKLIWIPDSNNNSDDDNNHNNDNNNDNNRGEGGSARVEMSDYERRIAELEGVWVNKV